MRKHEQAAHLHKTPQPQQKRHIAGESEMKCRMTPDNAALF
jgi:hypothetical protein